MADSISELKASLKCDGFKNLYYLYGKDIVSVENAYKFICSHAVKKGDEVYNMHTFDGRNFNIDEFTDACEALPMFADYVLCAVNDLNAEDMNANDLNWLVKFISDLPDTTILVFYYTGFDVTGGKKAPTTKNKKISDTVSKYGKVYNFEPKSADVLAKEIVARCTKSGTPISKENALIIVQLCRNDTLIIGNELDKLIAYCENREITAQDITDLCPRQLDAKVYDLANAIVRKDRFKAVNIINDLKLEMVEPITILYAVTSSMLDLYRAKVAVSSRRTPSDVMEDFKYSKILAFKVNNAFRDVRYYSVKDLRSCLKILTETDVALKSSRNDKMIILEEAIIKMLSLR